MIVFYTRLTTICIILVKGKTCAFLYALTSIFLIGFSFQKRLSHLWWLQIVTPIEVKVDMKDLDDAIRQLARYMRQMLREQQDRRFVIGFILLNEEVSVWLCDRSGLLGTETTFNIHKVCSRFLSK